MTAARSLPQRLLCVPALTAVLMSGQLVASAPSFALAPVDAVQLVPLQTVTDWAVDEPAARIFYDDGSNGSGVVVTDLEGVDAVAVPGTGGATALSVAPGGSTVFAAQSQQQILAIDASSLQVVATYATGADICATDVAATGTRVWFGYTHCAGDGPPGLGYVDLSHSPASVAVGLGESDDLGRPQLEWNATSPATMIVNSGWGDLVRYDISGQSPVLALARYHYLEDPSTALCATSDLTEPADGSLLFLLCNDTVRVVSTSDLTDVRTYPAADRAYPISRQVGGIAVTADGSSFAVGFTLGGLDVADVFSTSSGAQIDSYLFGECSSGGAAFANCLNPGGLQFGSTGVLYALTSTAFSDDVHPTIHTLADHSMEPTELTVTAPTTAQHDSAITITGQLTSSGSGLGRARPVHLWRHDAQGDHWISDAIADADGNFSAGVAISVAGEVTFYARYFGDEHHADTTASATVDVPKIEPSFEPPAMPGPFGYGTVTGVQGRLVPEAWVDGGTMTLSARPTDLPARVIGSGAPGLQTLWTLDRNTTFSVDYSGDDRYLPGTTQMTALVHALVSSHLHGYYGRTGAGLPIYHLRQPLRLTTRVAPNHGGECVYVEVQYYAEGSWRLTHRSSCVRLDERSRATWSYRPPAALGAYRARVHVPADDKNVASQSSWLHLRYTK